jgi:hypothetical protein
MPQPLLRHELQALVQALVQALLRLLRLSQACRRSR